MAGTRIPFLVRTDIESNWATANPILKKGEPAHSKDTNNLKIGDGVKTWDLLDNLAQTGGGSGTIETATTIKTKYESNADTNVFTDAEKTKLNNTPTDVNAALALKADKSDDHFKGLFINTLALPITGIDGDYAYVDGGIGNDVSTYVWDSSDNGFKEQAGTSTAETAASIKTKYESNADTNAFTDLEKTKLTGLESNATADQTDVEIKTAYENNADTNAFTDSDKTKLVGLEKIYDKIVNTEVERQALTGLTAGDKIYVRDTEKVYTVGVGKTTGADTDVEEQNKPIENVSQKSTTTNDDYIIGGTGIKTLVDGQLVNFTPDVDNIGASTINIDGIGAKAITKKDGTAIDDGTIKAGDTVELIYDLANDRFYINSSNTPGEVVSIGGTTETLLDTQLIDGVSSVNIPIPLGYDEYKIKFYTPGLSASSRIQYRFNSNIGYEYSYTYISNGSVVVGSTKSSIATESVNRSTPRDINLTLYNAYNGRISNIISTIYGNTQSIINAGFSTLTDDVTAIQIFIGAGTFNVGTEYKIYGIK